MNFKRLFLIVLWLTVILISTPSTVDRCTYEPPFNEPVLHDTIEKIHYPENPFGTFILQDKALKRDGDLKDFYYQVSFSDSITNIYRISTIALDSNPHADPMPGSINIRPSIHTNPMTLFLTSFYSTQINSVNLQGKFGIDFWGPFHANRFNFNIDAGGGVNFVNMTFNRSNLNVSADLQIENCLLSNTLLHANIYVQCITKLSNITFNNVHVECSKLDIEDLTIDSNNVITLNDTAWIGNVRGTGILKLKNGGRFTNNPIHVYLRSPAIDHLEFTDGDITIHIDNSLEIDDRISLNRKMAKYYEDDEKKKEFDIEAQKLEYQKNGDWWSPFIRENWNNYGYNKYLIFQNSVILLIFFFSINWLIYPRLLYKGYTIKEYETANRLIKRKYKKSWKYEFFNAIYCFTYTIMVFWGLKLNLENLKVWHNGYVLLILSQYLAGLICLAYIANLILTQ